MGHEQLISSDLSDLEPFWLAWRAPIKLLLLGGVDPHAGVHLETVQLWVLEERGILPFLASGWEISKVLELHQILLIQIQTHVLTGWGRVEGT